ETFEQRHQREQIAGPGGGEDSRGASAAPSEAVGGKRSRLLVAYHPVLEVRLLPQRLINRYVVNTGDSEPRRNSVPEQGFNKGLRAGELDRFEHYARCRPSLLLETFADLNGVHESQGARLRRALTLSAAPQLNSRSTPAKPSVLGLCPPLQP